jgi:hypothetical protein
MQKELAITLATAAAVAATLPLEHAGSHCCCLSHQLYNPCKVLYVCDRPYKQLLFAGGRSSSAAGAAAHLAWRTRAPDSAERSRLQHFTLIISIDVNELQWQAIRWENEVRSHGLLVSMSLSKGGCNDVACSVTLLKDAGVLDKFGGVTLQQQHSALPAQQQIVLFGCGSSTSRVCITCFPPCCALV